MVCIFLCAVKMTDALNLSLFEVVTQKMRVLLVVSVMVITLVVLMVIVMIQNGGCDGDGEGSDGADENGKLRW